MRIGIVAAGFVGATAAYAMVLLGLASRVTLVDLERRRAEGEAMDLAHAAPQALLLVATNPVEVLTQVAFEASGLPEARVIGSGTTLDAARLRSLVGGRAGVSPKHVHGYVLGEHGDSELVAWSGLRVVGRPLPETMGAIGRPWGPAQRAELETEVRRATGRIIERKRASCYGVGTALVRIANAVADDEHAALARSAEVIRGVLADLR